MKRNSSLNILVVDDEPETVELLSLLLKRKYSAEIHQAYDFKSAIDKIKSSRFDLVTLDYQLPDGNGLSLLQEIMSVKEPPPVVMVTGRGDEHIAVEAFKMGAAGYVVKDTKISVMLVEEVKSALSKEELKRTEKALTDTEETIKDLFKLSNQGIVITDSNRIIIFANQRAANISGLETVEEFLGMSSDDLYAVEEEQNRLYKILSERGAVENFEVRLKRKSGESFWASLSVTTRYDESGQILNAITFCSDITERKRVKDELRQSEERLKKAQEIGRIGFWEYDIYEQELIWSEETFKLYERDIALGPPTPEEEAEYYSPKQKRLLSEQADRAIKEGLNFQNEMELNLPSGRHVLYSTTMQPVKDDKGSVRRLFGTVQDITDWKLKK